MVRESTRRLAVRKLRLATALPIGHAEGVIDTAKLPTGWRIVAVPSNWDAEDPHNLDRIQPVKLGPLTHLPSTFALVLQSEAMADQEPPEALIISFAAAGDNAPVMSGLGDRWLLHMREVDDEVPADEWQPLAKTLIAAFAASSEVRESTAAFTKALPDLPRRIAATASELSVPTEATGQRRRKITPEHLEEVARIYLAAEEKPTRAVQLQFGVAHSTAAKWVKAARENDLLPPAKPEESPGMTAGRGPFKG